MSWGVTPILLEEKQEVFELFDYATEECLKQGFLCKGDVAVYTSGGSGWNFRHDKHDKGAESITKVDNVEKMCGMIYA